MKMCVPHRTDTLLGSYLYEHICSQDKNKNYEGNKPAMKGMKIRSPQEKAKESPRTNRSDMKMK